MPRLLRGAAVREEAARGAAFRGLLADVSGEHCLPDWLLGCRGDGRGGRDSGSLKGTRAYRLALP